MDSERRRMVRDLVIVGLVALVVRLAWVAVVRSVPVSDFLFYQLRAIDLASGRGYVWHGHPTAYWPPGYPLILSVIYRVLGPSVRFAKLANVLFWTVTALLAYVLGRRLGGQRTGLIAGLIVALYPDFIFYSSILASENLFVALLSASMLLVILVVTPPAQKHDWLLMAVAGLLFGYAGLTRAFIVLVPLFLVPIVLVSTRTRGLRRGLVLSAVLLGCMAIVLVPWVARNWIVMGRPVLATEGGVTLWIGNHPGASGAYDVKDEPHIATLATTEGEMAENQGYTRLALQFIVQHPVEWLSYAPRKLYHLFDEQPVIKKAFYKVASGSRVVVRGLSAPELWIHARANGIASTTRVLQAVYWLLGVAGLVIASVRKRTAALVLLVPVAYLLLFSVSLGHGESRYLISVAPLLAPGIGYLACLVADKARPARSA